jgi:hypothetical protein
MDLGVPTLDGIVITQRVHGAVLICVKTAVILGAVLSLDSLREEDYMRLVNTQIYPSPSRNDESNASRSRNVRQRA